MPGHIIHKQKVTLRVSKMEDAHLYQGRISHLLRNELLSQIESAFDKYFPTDQIIRIDYLQLDLGKLSKQNFEQEFKDEFVKALAEALSEQKNGAHTKVLSDAQSQLNALTYFLEKGNLPWYTTSKKAINWEKELLNSLSANEYNDLVNWLKNNHQNNPIILERIVLQFSNAFLKKVGSAMVASDDWGLVYQDFAYLFGGNRRDRLWERVFESLLRGRVDIENSFQISEIKSLMVKDLINAGGSAQSNAKEQTVPNKKPDDDEDTLYVNNSGIVLLHYFLKSFFEALKLYADGKFVNDKAHQRAVLLLHHLATGESEAAEFDLSLQKILCGYPMEKTLPASIKLTKKEVEESGKLLTTIIDYWEPLKNTSIDGFRDTFLKREGRLIAKENSWLLTVEQKTVDILLGKLPWGFSTIRLPWMEHILNVDWY
jgi:hypothetical protein